MFPRIIAKVINEYLAKGRNILLLGPRQTGKTTLIQQIPAALFISFIQPRLRLRYERDPSLLADEIEVLAETMAAKPLVIVDEVQKVPLIMDVIQDLIDRGIAQFIITGSSARKLKRSGSMNLLPGRVIPLHMDPLTLPELKHQKMDLETMLLYGTLPQIYLTEAITDKNELLNAYVSLYLEEEIRAESVVRNLANFAQFMELAASEAGNTVNYLKLSQEIGVAHSTIAAYYQIGEDCLLMERVPPFLQGKTRRKLQRAQKYLFFDLGLRRIAAREGVDPARTILGRLFEQFVGLELLRHCRFLNAENRLFYWRDTNGFEIDWILQLADGQLIPIEVKLTDAPREQDAKYLNIFLNEYTEAKVGYIICQTPRKAKITPKVYALPWQEMLTVF